MSVEELQSNRPIKDLIEKQKGLADKIQPRIPREPQIQSQIQVNESDKKDQSDLLEFSTQVNRDGLMKVTLKAKELQECPGVDIVAVVDRSGSMNCECAAADENGKSLENGFSVLDIVKHSVKTVVKTLRPQDRLSLVIYDDKTDVMFTLENMNEDGQQMALPIIDSIESRNSTDIFSALKEAVNIVQMR